MTSAFLLMCRKHPRPLQAPRYQALWLEIVVSRLMNWALSLLQLQQRRPPMSPTGGENFTTSFGTQSETVAIDFP